MKKMLLAIAMVSLLSCDKETCPEGSFELNDAEGNLIDCIDTPSFNLKSETDVFIQVKRNTMLETKLELLK